MSRPAAATPDAHKAYAPKSVACFVLTISDTKTDETDTSGNLVQSGYVPDALPRELDVTGNEAGFEDPYIIQTFDPDLGFIEPFVSFGNLANGQTGTYVVDSMQVPRNHFDRMTDFAFQG